MNGGVPFRMRGNARSSQGNEEEDIPSSLPLQDGLLRGGLLQMQPPNRVQHRTTGKHTGSLVRVVECPCGRVVLTFGSLQRQRPKPFENMPAISATTVEEMASLALSPRSRLFSWY
jgi:hypothetical protein